MCIHAPGGTGIPARIFFRNLHHARDVLLLLRVVADGHQRADFLEEFGNAVSRLFNNVPI